jgi:hypothetical protein
MPKAIRYSVGRGGRNALPQDVMTVQYLLNCVPQSKGGPSPELVVDGIAGPKTMAAIACFQRGALATPDGRVDPGGPTIARLLQYDPYPGQPMPPASSFPKMPAGQKQAGYKQDGPPGSKQGGVPGWKDLPGGAYKQTGSQGYPPGSKQGGVPGWKDLPGGGIKQTGVKQMGQPGIKDPGIKSGGW